MEYRIFNSTGVYNRHVIKICFHYVSERAHPNFFLSINHWEPPIIVVTFILSGFIFQFVLPASQRSNRQFLV